MPRYVVESCAAGSVVREQRERARLAAELGTGIRYVLGVNKSVSLLGAGATQTTISGGGPVVEVASSVSVAMDGLKITGGSSLVDGGGIRNLGTLVVTNAIVSGNTTTTTGGGIVNGTAETPGTLTRRAPFRTTAPVGPSVAASTTTAR